LDTKFTWLEKLIHNQFKELEYNDFFVRNFNKILELLANEELSQSINESKDKFSTLLNAETFLDKVLYQITLLMDIKITMNEKSESLSNFVVKQYDAILKTSLPC
jgi:hypothetical protein